jgi:hypothetical protein
MKNKILIIISVLFMLLASSSCNDWLDVNHDPNALEEIPDAKVLLPAAQVGIGNNLMGWDFGFGGAFWVEYWTQSYTAYNPASLPVRPKENLNLAKSTIPVLIPLELKKSVARKLIIAPG